MAIAWPRSIGLGLNHDNPTKKGLVLWLRRARELGMNREKPRRCRAFEDDVEGRDCSPDADDKAQAKWGKKRRCGVGSTNSVFGTIERSMGTVMLRCRRKSLTFVQAVRPQLEHSRDTKCLFPERE